MRFERCCKNSFKIKEGNIEFDMPPKF
uniref:Uncharacterized protein n=1 Tax=Anguilla anguilla TaxID=7936 RepID=A0A0E9VWD4_ANGAN